ncbi:LysR family transcriptional regulator [Rhizobium sp. SSA_523]|uniref:LysR family transcriptional regulator n=1 Tax=Rhizobium sp. SSA_523 TaxID=2952477 RepID=UPI0020904028|nr:LysR family transcriptional regulator [Rhizobium sp. SSA_523]MCO5733066.1 LysR family transcriptional regulator [Rhizobium sp. SSA_523]WKC23946.1 LysR family transcriptional regulator [Rhizobium sp. SSA_523]
MKNIGWDLYAQFLEVARHGGLSGAGASTGLSPATLGRKMLDLEAALGRPLFLRSRTGYRLTADGETLMAYCLEMEGVVRSLSGWASETQRPPLVRLSCGTWMARFLLGSDLPKSLRERCRLEVVIGERRANLAHRQSDVGIRAFEPQEANLASAMLGQVAYAAYRARSDKDGKPLPYIAVTEEEAPSAYLQYPHRHHQDRIGLIVSRPSFLLDAARAGAGLAVLPCFVGDCDEDLQRDGGEIPALRHRQWIVMNAEDRHRREIRDLVDRVSALIRQNADLFAGQREHLPGSGMGEAVDAGSL